VIGMREQWINNKAVVLLGAGAVVAALALRGRRPEDGWVFPLPSLNGRPPVVSSGWGSPRRDPGGPLRSHRGVDLMYKRRSRAELVDRFPPGTPNGSTLFFMPDHIPVFAAHDGKVWSAGETSRGHAVVLNHGKPWATFYQHLECLFVTPTARGRSGQRVRAGEIIGIVGASPLDGEGLKHLHFEVWKGGAGEAAIDPEPMMPSWLVMPWTDGSLEGAINAAAA
jgi:murein DD-endopeptidase MepM/ murein hydrolase activator NlpD